MARSLPFVHPLRAVNRSRVMSALLDGAASSRPDLARHLDLSLMATTRITNELIEMGFIQEGAPSARSEPGRPPASLAINPSGAYVLGLKLHAFDQSMVLMDLAGRSMRRFALNFSAPTNGAHSLSELADQAITAIGSAEIDSHRVVGAGVALTGVVDRERGRLIDAPYLGWSSLDFAEFLERRLGTPVVVDRISSALLAAISRRSRPLLRNAILVNIGFAMTAGFLVDGTVAYGERLMAGHIGHLGTGDKRYLCSCGQRGCLNVAASGWAALADLGEVDDHVVSAEQFQKHRPQLTKLLQREERGEPAACQALERVGRTLGITIRPFQIALDSTRVFLSGPVGTARSLVQGVKNGIGDTLAQIVEPCEYLVDDAAALMALDEFVRSPRMDFVRLGAPTVPSQRLISRKAVRQS